jgi:acyl-CoA dehydrogenase
MSVTFDLSPELERYGAEIREWGLAEVRPLGRQADTDHEVPAEADSILAAAPVPLGRMNMPGDGLPIMKEGYDLVRNVWYENVTYTDCWLSEALNHGIGHQVIKAVGTEEQVERWYKPVVEQGQRTGFGMSEPSAGSDTAGILTTATRDRDSWVINGSKMYCSLGAIAEYIVVFATLDTSQRGHGIRAFVVEKDNPGLGVIKRNEDKLGFRCWVTSQMAFDKCVIPLGNIVGGTDAEGNVPTSSGLRAGLVELNRNRPNVSAMSIGLARAALDLTSDLLAEQQASFALHRWAIIESELGQMYASLDRARWLNRRALWMASKEISNRAEATIAKAYGPPNSERIIRRCMQLLGPEGASTELLLEKWYRDVKILDIFEGTGQIMRMLLSRELMGQNAGAR